jgi:excinuclease ABC subunit B
MQRAIDETSRRRERQVAHNAEHGIKPASIVKQVADIMEAAYPAPGKRKRRLAEDGARYDTMTPEQLMKRAAKLEKKMLRHARDLEFEEAARLRDEIRHIREEGLGISDRKAG